MYGQTPFMMPNLASNITKTSLLSKINWSSLLSNTQKVLNVANQAIPLYYQVKPVISNIKTLGKIGKEFNKLGTNTPVNNNVSSNIINNDLPTPNFFI